MEILFKNQMINRPKVSFILLDWSCRESLHFLHYINKQNVARDQYEVIWIEYYDRQSPEIRERLEEDQEKGTHPWVDQWVVMNMPKDLYYHKHLMYNVGIAISSGEIITICDSDAIAEPTFVETIIRSFEENPDIVLHLDEVRNNNRKFHPFNFPPMSEVLGPGTINYKDGTTTGLLDKEDPLHTRNYGACMCALRSDLIAIGGADEHVDYLGHVCGPYELTFRLLNLGKSEIWHPSELLYHVWHPGQAGDGNYVGPHDGKHMSTTALDALSTGRIQPLAENPVIEQLRTGNGELGSDWTARLIHSSYLKDWTHEAMDQSSSFNKWHTPESLGSYKQFNIFKYGEVVFGIPQSLGPIDLQLDHQRNLAQILRAPSLQQLHEQIDKSSGVDYSRYNYPLIRELIGESGYQWIKTLKSKIPDIPQRKLVPFMGFNLIPWGNRYYAVPHTLGKINLNEKRWRDHPEILSDTMLQALKKRIKSMQPNPFAHYRFPWLRKLLGEKLYQAIKSIKQLIPEKKPEIPTVQPQPVATLIGSHNKHNLIQLGSYIYAIPHSLGQINLLEDRFFDHPEVLSAITRQELVNLIDKTQSYPEGGLISTYRDHNIFRLGNRFYAVSQMRGQVDLSQEDIRRRKDLLSANSLRVLKTLVDAAVSRHPQLRTLLGPQAYKALRKIRDNFQHTARH